MIPRDTGGIRVSPAVPLQIASKCIGHQGGLHGDYRPASPSYTKVDYYTMLTGLAPPAFQGEDWSYSRKKGGSLVK
eukprot:9471413-Pyramimonas_sp.AAC.1